MHTIRIIYVKIFATLWLTSIMYVVHQLAAAVFEVAQTLFIPIEYLETMPTLYNIPFENDPLFVGKKRPKRRISQQPKRVTKSIKCIFIKEMGFYLVNARPYFSPLIAAFRSTVAKRR